MPVSLISVFNITAAELYSIRGMIDFPGHEAVRIAQERLATGLGAKVNRLAAVLRGGIFWKGPSDCRRKPIPPVANSLHDPSSVYISSHPNLNYRVIDYKSCHS